jgi:hypothetical protein
MKTKSEQLEWKAKAKPVMIAYLQKTIGYPQCGDHDIMNQVDGVWGQLVAHGLILDGMTYEMFYLSARREYMRREMWRTVGIGL